MTDFILPTDPLEFQTTRQSTKIAFLQNELKQLQDYVQDLEQVVKINKEALKIATGQHPQGNNKRKNLSPNDTTTSTIDASSNRGDNKNYQLLIEQLQEENMKLIEIIEKVKKERNIAQSKALISEQICEEAQRHEVEAVAELEEKINELRKLLQDKEYTIQELEKLKPIPEQEGVVIKYREVLSPTEQNLKLHNELDAVNAMLSKVSKELNKAQAEKQELATINFTLTNELAKIKATLSNPVNFPQKMTSLFNADGDMNNSAVFIPPVFGLEDDNSPLPSPLPDKVGGGIGAIQGHGHTKSPVPKLDLSKAKQIQEINAKKISQQPQAQNAAVDPKIMHKIKQLEGELEVARKRLSYEMINNKLLSDEIANLQRQNMQLSAANEILIKSNQRYEEKWQKIFYTMEFYKDFYHKYIDLITNRRAWNRSVSSNNYNFKGENIFKLKEKLNIDIDHNPDKYIKDLKRIDEENGKQVNVSILEADERENAERDVLAKNSENVYDFTREQCKIYLLNLAKDLYVNSNLNKSSAARNVLKRIEFGPTNAKPKDVFKLNRSVSNPLDYVSERKKLIFEPATSKKDAKIKKQRKETRLIDDQNEIFLKGGDEIEIKFMKKPSENENAKPHTFGDHENEMSFNVDPEEMNNKRLVEVSFISNNEILDQMKN